MKSLPDLTKQAAGTVGNSQAIGTDIAVITDPGPGRYKIWGVCRHTLIDGCRLLIGATTIISIIPATANTSAPFGPVIIDILNKTDDIILELATATGVSDTATGVVYAEVLVP